MSTNVLLDFRSHHPQPSDDQLLSEARSGDGRAFAELCQRYTGLLKQRISRIVRHREDTEDALQEIFLNAYRHMHSFRGNCSFSTWMVKIGINTSLTLLKSVERCWNTPPMWLPMTGSESKRGNSEILVRIPNNVT
jgi:RNA polymerase sigma-70 factor, ECF subfamily